MSKRIQYKKNKYIIGSKHYILIFKDKPVITNRYTMKCETLEAAEYMLQRLGWSTMIGYGKFAKYTNTNVKEL